MNSDIKTRDMDGLAAHRDKLCKKPRLTYLFFELTEAQTQRMFNEYVDLWWGCSIRLMLSGDGFLNN